MRLRSSCICSHPHVSMIVINDKVTFFQIRDGPFMPTLKLLHRCMCVLLLSAKYHSSTLAYTHLPSCAFFRTLSLLFCPLNDAFMHTQRAPQSLLMYALPPLMCTLSHFARAPTHSFPTRLCSHTHSCALLSRYLTSLLSLSLFVSLCLSSQSLNRLFIRSFAHPLVFCLGRPGHPASLSV
jgi:Pre-PUA-like domain